MKIWLIGSGGVRNIERTNDITIAMRRFSLSPFEVITSVNGELVPSVIRFSEMIKEKKDLTFSVRRLDATRIVRIQLKADQAKQ